MENDVEQTESRNTTGSVGMGIFLVLLGLLVIGSRFFVTTTSIYFIGLIMLIAGIGQVIGSFFRGSWSQFFLHMFLGIITTIVGFLVFFNPAASTLTISLLIATFLLAGGLFQAVSSLFSRHDNWGWVFLAGLVEMGLGFAIFANWPVSGFSTIGWFIGLALILNGFSAMVGRGAEAEVAAPGEQKAVRGSASYSSEIKKRNGKQPPSSS